MKTRILFVIDGMEFGGGERVFAQIMNGLPPDRYAPFLASGPQASFYEAIAKAGVKTFAVDFSNRFRPGLVRELMAILRKEQIHIVHGQGARAEIFARLASRLAGPVRYISTVAMPVEGYDVGPAKRLLYRVLDGFTERWVERFLVVSAVLKKTLIERHRIPPSRVLLIYNGIETDTYRPEEMAPVRERLRREFAIAEGDPLIGAIGRLVWQKGFHDLLEAIPLVLRDLPRARFLLVGDGPLKTDLQEQARSLGIGDRLLFAGHRTDIRDLLSAMDTVCIPSLLEGFPMVTLEAMAMERPLVATAIDGILEQIVDGVEGLLVPPRNAPALAQAMVRLAADPALASTLAAAARLRVVRDFSVRKMIDATIEVYERR
jgi:glycosyltransferase involved in cell wall biosynthesis